MKRIAYIIFLLITQFTFAQVEFSAKLSRTKIGLNENVRVEFVMNADGDNFQLPAFENFRLIGGPYQQVSTSIINGKRSYNRSFGYNLQPTKKGVLTIGSASITINGQTYKTEPIELTVTDAVQRPNDTTEQLIEPHESVHLIAQVSNQNPYLNEPITVLYKLYFKEGLGIRNFTATDNPEYNDFWSHNIDNKDYEAVSETYKGEAYSSVIVKKVVLYPQKSGKLSLAPLSMNLALEVPTNRRDFFGRRVYTSTNSKVSTGITNIEVKALPENGKPEDFSGAVGSFDFKVSTNKTAVRQGETIEMDVVISGKGNLELFGLPKPVVPSALEMYDPIAKKQINVSISGMSGSKSDKYTIIPQYQGKYIIKPLSFSYFDLDSKSYKTLTSEEILIDMIDGPISTVNQTAESANHLTKENQEVQTQFKFIELKTNLEPIKSEDILFSKPFFFWLFSPLLFIPLLIIAKRKKDQIDGDVVGNKLKATNRLAKKYLSQAKKNQHDNQKFYEALERALHNFLKAKLKIETSEMSKEIISALLAEKKADPSSIQDFIALLENAELVRYAPSLASSVDQDYDKAVKTITQLEKQIK
ncbi:MAG TPA: BatD family protein [Flavobacterium sp.]|nr:BatD family protein [Flavobacterium sp.]